jgi:hypothetical protein
VPYSFVDVWKIKRSNCTVKISSGGKSMSACFCVSDEAFIFYADKVAELFGFIEPTRVMMNYIIDQNTFFLEPLCDASSEESCNENENISLNSNDNEAQDGYDEVEDHDDESHNQQMIVVCQRLYFKLFNLILCLDIPTHFYYKLNMNIPLIGIS